MLSTALLDKMDIDSIGDDGSSTVARFRSLPRTEIRGGLPEFGHGRLGRIRQLLSGAPHAFL